MRIRFVAIFYFLVSLVMFLPGHKGMIVTDINGWIDAYQRIGWQGIFTSFNDHSLHYAYHFTGFICYKLFGVNTLCWGLFNAGSHALAALMAFIFFESIYTHLQLRFAALTAFAGGLVFLLGAYNAEPVLWAACIHYPLCVTLVMAALWCMIQYATKGKPAMAVLFVICFIVSVFFLELALALPFISIPILLMFRGDAFSRQRFVFLQLLLVFAVTGYFLLNKIMFGSAVGHYGASTHLNADPVLLASNTYKYFAKHFLFSQFWPYNHRMRLYGIFEMPVVAYVTVGVLVLTALVFLFWRKRMATRAQVVLLLLAASIAALAPVLNLFFTTIVLNECDRLGYLFGIFSAQVISVLAFGIMPYGLVLILFYIAANAVFLKQNVGSWRASGQVQEQLVKNYRWNNTPEVVILNLPDNYGGAYMYRSFDTASEWADAMKVRGIKTGHVTEILKYNMNTPSDSVIVEKLSDNELKVTLAQWGNWWWRNGLGAVSYATGNYQVTVDGSVRSYTVKFIPKKPGAVYLYQCGGHWRVVNDF